MHRANSVRHTEDRESQQPPSDLLNHAISKSNKSNHSHLSQAEASKIITPAALKTGGQSKQEPIQQQQQCYLKSCLSDGDFDEILIKVNDHESQECSNQADSIDPLALSPSNLDGLCGQRRRSSCSDVEEAKKVANNNIN